MHVQNLITVAKEPDFVCVLADADGMYYRNKDGAVIKYNCSTDNSTMIMNNSTFVSSCIVYLIQIPVLVMAIHKNFRLYSSSGSASFLGTARSQRTITYKALFHRAPFPVRNTEWIKNVNMCDILETLCLSSCSFVNVLCNSNMVTFCATSLRTF